jgi:DNA polymerase-3 subunit epsilon
MLVARRVLPRALDYKLGTLVEYAGLPVTDRYHRALVDAETRAHLTLYLGRALMGRFGLSDVTHDPLGRIQRTAKSQQRRLHRAVRRSSGVSDMK